MRWILESGEYSRQREALRRRTNWESGDGLPTLGWESADEVEPGQPFEPERLPRPRDLRSGRDRRSRTS